MRKIKEQELRNVVKQDVRKRYKYLLRVIADEEMIFSLTRDKEWVLAADNEGTELVPVWPAAEYAALCAKGEWLGAEPCPIALDLFLRAWIPGIRGDNRKIAVFPIPEHTGAVIEPERFAEDIQAELDEILFRL